MTRTHATLAGTGIASFVVFLIALLPARVVTDRFPAAWGAAGPEGTLWNGSLHSIDIAGWRLRETRWRLSPASALLGRLAARIETRVAGGALSTDASVSLSGTVTISELVADGPIAPLARRLNLPVSGGQYEVRIDTLRIADRWPTRLNAAGRVTNVPLVIMGTTAGPTGNYTVRFDADEVPEDGLLTGMLADDGGPIEVAGRIELTPPANYALRTGLKARAGAPAEIARALQFAGPTDADGRREFSLAGSL